MIHLASSLGGGAGIATRRIVEAQRAIGIDSHLLALTRGDAELQTHESILPIRKVQKFQSKALTLLQSKLIQNSKNLVTPFSLSLFTPFALGASNPEILNIHATYNLLSWRGIREVAEMIPTVVTLHDQRSFTGGCHYSWDCKGYLQDCSACPQVRKLFQDLPRRKFLEAKRNLESMNGLSIVSPSHWLARIASSSPLLKKADVYVIPNPVSQNFRGPELHDEEASVDSTLHVGFVSKDLHNPYKGLDLLLQALDLVVDHRPVLLHLMGEGDISEISRSHNRLKIQQSSFESDRERILVLSSCDVVVVPSKQDNSPSVVGECLVLGIPVIAARTGGITEVIEEFSLPSFQSNDSIGLSQLLVRQPKKHLDPLLIERVRAKYSYNECAARYLEVYRRVLI